MKFLYTTEIHQPISSVIELFSNKDHLKKWNKEFLSHETIEGVPNTVGATTKLVYKSITIFETIVAIHLPHEIIGYYEHKTGKRTVMVHHTSHRFLPLSENKTLFELEMKEVKFIGLLPKVLSKLMSSMFEKYHQNEVDQFKKFVENQKQ